MITQVLPSAVGRAKDLGVINIANALPQVLAPGVAAIVLGVGLGATPPSTCSPPASACSARCWW